jgi:hypothetical protein
MKPKQSEPRNDVTANTKSHDDTLLDLNKLLRVWLGNLLWYLTLLNTARIPEVVKDQLMNLEPVLEFKLELVSRLFALIRVVFKLFNYY